MQGILALLGSGEFTPEVTEIDRFLLSHIKNPKIAIIPTAAGRETDYNRWVEKGIKHFKKLGIPAEGVSIITRSDANRKDLVERLKKFNFYYFSGGNPGYLLDTLKGSNCWKLIKKNYSRKNVVLAGSSAGAMVMGNFVWSKVHEYIRDGVFKPWEKGLALTDFGIMPHYREVLRRFKGRKLAELKDSLPQKVKIVGIEENTAYIKINNIWLVKGKGKIHLPAF